MSVESVQELRPGMNGRWLVTTQGTRHLWDLDAMTYTRMPGADSHAGSMLYDNRPVPITRVSMWPSVGGFSLVWFDDPDEPDLVEHWRKSSRIKTIERAAGQQRTDV